MNPKCKYFIFIVLNLCLITSFFGQNEKPKLRLSVDYLKEMGHAKYLILSARYKVDKKYIPAAQATFLIYQNYKNDSSLLIGKAKLNKAGKAKIRLQKNIDTQNLNFSIKLVDTTKYRPLKKNIKIKDAILEIHTDSEGDKNFLIGTLTEGESKKPLKGVALKVGVKRAFRSLNLGDKELYFTDNKGTVKVEIPKGIPAINGVLTLNIVLEESPFYGTIKAFTIAPLGVPIIEDTSFDQRRLWSARGKEPLFLFFLSISLVVIIWSAIIQVIYNISKYMTKIQIFVYHLYFQSLTEY